MGQAEGMRQAMGQMDALLVDAVQLPEEENVTAPDRVSETVTEYRHRPTAVGYDSTVNARHFTTRLLCRRQEVTSKELIRASVR